MRNPSFLALLALLSACNVKIDTPDNPVNVNPSTVGFNVYVNRGLQTKAGWEGVLTLGELKNEANGFGVFAYYGNGALYNETMIPDFMYDQQVKYNTSYSVWDYTPVKYWPNEYGEAASSEAADRLTFFAYAPFADVTPSTGVVTDNSTTGIIGMSRNIAAGDPVVMYSSSLTPGSGVDLCWGVAAEAFTSSVDGDNNNVAAGYPYLNVIKPKTGDHLKFEFNHALAQLNVQINADINKEGAGDDKTKIYVRSVTFNGFSMRGSLNLNSNKTEGPIWYDISGTGKLKREPVTVYDGRTDGMEGVATASDVSEKPFDLNPVLVQSKPYGDAQLSAGVTTTAVNLFNNTDENAPLMVIPTPGAPMSVTIVYDVETEDNRLTGYLSDGVTHGSSVENKITKTITTDQGNMILSSGKKYVVKLHLGLTSVKFDADVAAWDDTSYPNPYDVNLPENTTVISGISFQRNNAEFTEATIWKSDELTAPTVLVNGVVTTSACSWASNDTSIASVDASGNVTALKSGYTTITVTVDGDTKDYDLYVNEVTGVSLSAENDKQSLVLNETVRITATVTNTGYGTISYFPVTWGSSRPTCITLSPGENDLEIVATGSMPANGTVWAMVDVKYLSSDYNPNDDDYNSLHYDYYDDEEVDGMISMTCVSSSKNGFRGYELSPGILKSESTGYSFTDGILIGIVDDDSGSQGIHNHYHFSFSDGSSIALTDDGASSTTPFSSFYHDLTTLNLNELPSGWRLPSNANWDAIINGRPESQIMIGDETLGKGEGFTFVTINVSNSESYFGLLLFRDGTVISQSALSSHNVSLTAASTDFSDNNLTVAQLEWLITECHCAYLPGLSYYNTVYQERIRETQTVGMYDGRYLSLSQYDFLMFQEDDIDIFHDAKPCSVILVKTAGN